MEDKIDLVYTWLDGNDEEWKKKKLFWQEKLNPNAGVVNPCRFSDDNELKYSLRSVEKYANWINKIYIVTDNQIPKWLNTNHPKIKVIDHKEILPIDATPNFNSVAIEHCIVNIPNLAEKFLYANDDTLFFDYVKPEYFFSKNKGVICRYLREISAESTGMYENQLRNAAKIIKKEYNKSYFYLPHHNIDAYIKSDVLDCYAKNSNQIDETIFNRFREYTDVSRHVYSCYSCAIGHGNWKKLHKVDSELPLWLKVFNALTKRYSKDSLFLQTSWNVDFEVEVKKLKPKWLCINDDEDTNEKQRKNLKEFLNTKFGNKSVFELEDR